MTQLKWTALVCLVLASSSVVGCGGTDTKQEARDLAQKSVLSQSPPLKKTLVTQRDYAKLPTNSVERAFLQYWSSLQYQAWSTSASFYEPGLRAAIHTDRLIGALQSQVAYFRTVKPEIQGTFDGPNGTVLRYLIKAPSGTLTPGSIAWRRSRTGWRISFDPSLNEYLRAFVQSSVQASIDPNAKTAAPEAVKAGQAAAQLQNKYIAKKP